MDAIFQTESSFALLVLRLGLAITFFAHGSQKVLGWFGGHGPTDVLNNWDEKYGIPRRPRHGRHLEHGKFRAGKFDKVRRSFRRSR